MPVIVASLRDGRVKAERRLMIIKMLSVSTWVNRYVKAAAAESNGLV